MLVTVKFVLLSVGGESKKERSIQVIIMVFNIREAVVQYIMLQSPHLFIRADQVDGIRHQVVEPFVPGVGSMNCVMHNAHSYTGHSESTKDV